MPPNPPTGPPSKEALRLALELERQGKSLEVQALRAVNAQYQGLDIRHLAALVGLVSDHAAPAERVANLAALMGAFREAALPLTQPPSRLGELLGQAVQAGMTASARMMGLKAARPSAQAEYTQHAAQRLGLYWNKEQTRLAGEVSSVLLEGLQRGQSAAQLTLRLRERLDVSRTRSRLVVANEVGNALAYANQQSQQEAGGTHYIWVTCHDLRVRPAHQERDGKVFAWDNPPSDGHPGEPVRCRCVAVPVVDNRQVHNGLKFEQLTEGTHVLRVEIGELSKNKARFVLRGATKARLMQFLRQFPLSKVVFANIEPRLMGGFYNPSQKLLTINLNRSGSTIGSDSPAGWQKDSVTGVSSWGRTKEEAMRISFVHELGHHLIEHYAPIYELARDAYKDVGANFISKRASSHREEYFCESLAAYTFFPDLLMKHDPVGYKMIQDFYAMLGGEE